MPFSFKNIVFRSGIILIVLLSFNSLLAQHALQTGLWQGTLQLNDSIQLPFNFNVQKNKSQVFIEIMNAEERIKVDEISFVNDSVFIKMPVFDSEFKCVVNEEKKLKGVWINHAKKNKNIIPFNAICTEEQKNKLEIITYDRDSRWECVFTPPSNNHYKTVGIFKQNAIGSITGTFLTETGDYRYLEGNIDARSGSFHLSCFDGAHAFLFTGEIKGDSIASGHFYSGADWHENWTAKRNDKFELRNPDSLTYLKPGFNKVDFSFKNLQSKNVSLSDDRFKNKVVIIQLMGTWCPNCTDETKFLAPFYDKYKSKGLEIIALAFERTDDFNKAVSNVSRSKNKFGANYEFLITMKTGKDQASEALPMLNKVMAFPTTIYIDKKGTVRKIYTGFNGPATGDKYIKHTNETTDFVEKLLAE